MAAGRGRQLARRLAAVRGLTAGQDYTLVRTWTVSAIKQPSRVTIIRCRA